MTKIVLCDIDIGDAGWLIQRLTLWTHKSHEAACALYVKFGFEVVDEKPVNSFGQDLIEPTWTIDLTV